MAKLIVITIVTLGILFSSLNFLDSAKTVIEKHNNNTESMFEQIFEE